MSNKFYTDVQIKADISLDNETANTVPVLDASKKIISSAVTSTELGYVSGVTSSIQDQIDSKASQVDFDNHLNDTTGAHAASAIAVTPTGNLAADDVQEALVELQGDIDGLDSRLDAVEPDVADLVTLSGVAANSTTLGTFTGAIIPDSSTIKAALQSLETSIESLPDPITYEGTYDASTNTPTLANGIGNNGDLRQVVVAGTVDFGAGNISFAVGDKVVYNGTVYEKWDMTDAVASVNGQTGVVVLDTDDVAEGAALYFTDERAQDAVGAALLSTDTVTLTYTDATPSIEADVITQMSITSDASGVKLVGDAATPGNSQYYGTNGSGTKGFYPVATGSAGDIPETSFSIANNQAALADITGLVFSNAVVRSFDALISVEIDAASDLFEVFTIKGVQRGADWSISIEGTGDDSLIAFDITSAGQLQYTSGNYTTFVAGTMKFRAITTGV